jgi:hypothetical protein
LAVIARSVKTVNDITKCGQMAFGLAGDDKGRQYAPAKGLQVFVN